MKKALKKWHLHAIMIGTGMAAGAVLSIAVRGE